MVSVDNELALATEEVSRAVELLDRAGERLLALRDPRLPESQRKKILSLIFAGSSYAAQAEFALDKICPKEE